MHESCTLDRLFCLGPHKKGKKILNVHISVWLDLFKLNLAHLKFLRVFLCISKEFSSAKVHSTIPRCLRRGPHSKHAQLLHFPISLNFTIRFAFRILSFPSTTENNFGGIETSQKKFRLSPSLSPSISLNYPNIATHTLPSVLQTLPMVLTRRICSAIKRFFVWRSLPLLSWPQYWLQQR